jgi:N-acetylglucosamine kinase-like BadF-type ATPase
MYLGVDGGGTKTAFILIDDAGNIRAHHQEAGSYHLEIGIAGVAAVLAKGTAETLAKAGATTSDIQYTFFGMPAYGEDSGLQKKLDPLPRGFLTNNNYHCGNDMICSWAGSLACSDGISTIAGTGSMAYGEYAGRNARAGGWGELFSDEGSAHWIAREGLNLFSKMSDGRTQRGALHKIIRQHFSLDSDLDLCAAIYSDSKSARSSVAQLAKLVWEAVIAGDEQANAIFISAARELSDIVNAVRNTLQVPPDVILPVSYSGGVFDSNAVVLDGFRKLLEENSIYAYSLITPRYSPVIGAALYAAKKSGSPLQKSALDNLTEQARNY